MCATGLTGPVRIYEWGRTVLAGDGDGDDAEHGDENDGNGGVNPQVVQMGDGKGEERADAARDGAPLGQLYVLVRVILVMHSLRCQSPGVRQYPYIY